MFLLTLDSHDPKVIQECLREIAKSVEDCCIGQLSNGVRYEYDCIDKWKYMGDFLHFNPDGNTLKAQE